MRGRHRGSHVAHGAPISGRASRDRHSRAAFSPRKRELTRPAISLPSAHDSFTAGFADEDLRCRSGFPFLSTRAQARARIVNGPETPPYCLLISKHDDAVPPSRVPCARCMTPPAPAAFKFVLEPVVEPSAAASVGALRSSLPLRPRSAHAQGRAQKLVRPTRIRHRIGAGGRTATRERLSSCIRSQTLGFFQRARGDLPDGFAPSSDFPKARARPPPKHDAHVRCTT